MSAPSIRSQLRRSLRFLTPLRGGLALVVALSLAAACITAAEPLVMKLIFDRLGSQPTMMVLLGPIGLLLALLVGRELLNAILEARIWKVRLGINEEMTRETVDRLQTLP